MLLLIDRKDHSSDIALLETVLYNLTLKHNCTVYTSFWKDFSYKYSDIRDLITKLGGTIGDQEDLLNHFRCFTNKEVAESESLALNKNSIKLVLVYFETYGQLYFLFRSEDLITDFPQFQKDLVYHITVFGSNVQKLQSFNEFFRQHLNTLSSFEVEMEEEPFFRVVKLNNNGLSTRFISLKYNLIHSDHDLRLNYGLTFAQDFHPRFEEFLAYQGGGYDARYTWF